MAEPVLFITSVGKGPYAEVDYQLDSRRWRSKFAPVAVARLSNLAGARALVLLTDAAQASGAELVCELTDAGLHSDTLAIPAARNEDEILDVFARLQASVPPGARVVLDVTFALRHLPFVYLATLAYLVGLRQVEVQGIYYGAYDLPGPDDTRPILEVTALFHLLQWYHALASARDLGDWTPVATRLRQDAGHVFRRLGDRQLSRLQTPAERFARALAMGLPIEAGLRAAELREALGNLTAPVASASAARLALQALHEQLPGWAMHAPGRKRDLVLTRDELQRQLRVAQWYLQHHDHEKALAVMRESLVSAQMVNAAPSDRWLDYGHRKPFENVLNAVSERAKARVATEQERALASLWDAIATKRNQFAHAGMTEEEVASSDVEVAALLQRCQNVLAEDMVAAIRPGPTNCLLLTPMGLSPGVLYSGVLQVKPDQLLIVTSPEAEARIPEALGAAAAVDCPYKVLGLSDPHLGYREIDRCIGEEIDRLFATASRVVVNVTGGTTVMQYAVERLAVRAQRLGARVSRCALIDRRVPEEQRANPYVLGEIVWLDEDEKERWPAPAPAGGAGKGK